MLRFERLFYRLLTHVIRECCLPFKDYTEHILLLIIEFTINNRFVDIDVKIGLVDLLVDRLTFSR